MKKWDIYVYGDVNIDEIIKEADKIPPPGEEWEVDTMWAVIYMENILKILLTNLA